MRNRYRSAVLAACGALAVTQVAAGVASRPATASEEEVTISVSNLPPSTEAGAREAFLQRVEEFEAEYPNITSSQTSTSGTSPRSPPSSPAARCRRCSRSRSPTRRA